MCAYVVTSSVGAATGPGDRTHRRTLDVGRANRGDGIAEVIDDGDVSRHEVARSSGESVGEDDRIVDQVTIQVEALP